MTKLTDSALDYIKKNDKPEIMSSKQSYFKYANSFRAFGWMILGLLAMAMAFMFCSIYQARQTALYVGYAYIGWLLLYYVLAYFRWRKYIGFSEGQRYGKFLK